MKDACNQEIGAERERVQTKLAEFKTRGNGLTADARIKHTKLVNDLEEEECRYETKLKELSEANEDVWDLLRYCF